MKHVVVAVAALLSSLAVHAAEPERFVGKVGLPSGQTVVVAEGEYEARSLGSFGVRLYAAAQPGDETTFFVAGLVRARDGTIEDVVLTDVDGDGRPEVIVNVRSVGTGSYRSAYAFAYGEKRLALRAAVEGLPRDADTVAALRKAARKPK